MLRVCLLVCSLVSGTELTFQYQPLFRRSNEPCKICYGDDCLQMDQARCEYYVGTDGILHEEDLVGEDNPVVRAEVDRLMYSFMEKASSTLTECIPLVSQYTDCTKENICTGCKSCNCNLSGSWNCTTINKCRADVKMDVDHRMLVFVMENLKNSQTNNRPKRHIQESLNNLNTNKISFDDISQWMFEDAPLSNDEETTQNSPKSNGSNETTTAPITETPTQAINTSSETTPTEDYLRFDEVLNNIAFNSKTHSRRKPLDIVHNDSIAFDYMLFDEDNITEAATDKPEYENMDNKYTPSNADGETEIVIDLLESAKKNQGETLPANWIDNTETDNITNFLDPSLDYIDNFVLGSKYVMKRDININNQQTNISTVKANITSNVKELRNNVLLPLSNIISDKQKELEELLRVSENLIKIMSSYKNQTNQVVLQENKGKSDDTNSSIYIYNFKIEPELENEFRSSNNNLLQKYIVKLKRDIYEVIRDIASIHKLKGAAIIPQDLKILLRAMKHYVRSQAEMIDKENKSDFEMIEMNEMKSRRNSDTNNNSNKTSFVSEIVDILKVIDQNIPESNALAPLSTTTRKIIQRVINNNFINEFLVIGLRVFDPEYNLTNDLRKIGTDWPRMTNTVVLSKVYNKLHAMKLLYFILSGDIIKMNDALELLDFAYNRRMILLEGNLGGEIMEKINKGLQAIKDKIKVIINLHNHKHKSKQKTKEATKKVHKESFLRKLKNILKTSKSDILSMLKRGVPKKDIVKGLAKKKIDEITRRRFMEFEDTMRKWQNKLNLNPRDKRFARDDNYKNRMKNILPKYLRGKVKPVIAAKKSKNANRKQRKQNKHFKTTTIKSKFASKSNTSKLRDN